MRIPLVRNTTSKYFDALMLNGEFHLFDQRWNVSLLVDTGAGVTLFSGAGLADVHKVYPKGKKGPAGGVGGEWPARFFEGVAAGSLFISLSEGTIQIKLPRVGILAPFRRTVVEKGRILEVTESMTGRAATKGARQGLREEVFEQADLPHLLGRDVFRASQLKLTWDPVGESFVEAP